MPAKITKTDMIDAIAFYFAKKGQRLSNLKKSTIKKLEEIIKKYDIDLTTSLVELKESREKDMIAKQERKAERDRQIAEQDAEYERLYEERKRINKLIFQQKLMMWEELSDEDKEKVRQFQYDIYVEYKTQLSREEYKINDEWIVNCSSEELLLELYEGEMIKKGFWKKGDDGEFYKTIKVKRQNK